MRLIFSDDAWEDYLFWQKQDRRMVDRINKLIKETTREPFSGQCGSILCWLFNQRIVVPDNCHPSLLFL
uniref:type II toxin-antitoxin system YoeB family toxin n=1 Tax=Aeromonas sp. QDB05 TaxID=2990478 RepID=UPI0022E76958